MDDISQILTPGERILLTKLNELTRRIERLERPEQTGATRARPDRLKDVDPEKVYTSVQLSDILCVTARTIRKYCLEGTFPGATKVAGGRRWLIPGREVLDLLRLSEGDRDRPPL